ncbi:MAG: RDD family protein [Bdellovibrio sp.]|nr:RDD family protein [Bdellovibrio sp.]
MSQILKRRISAYFCDQAIIWFGHSILYSVFFQTFMPTFKYFPWRAQDQIFELLAESGPMTFIMCFLTYYLIAPWLGNGQTVGQRLFGVAIHINQKKRNHTTVPLHLEVLSYILRGMGLLIIQMTYGLPFLLHFVKKDGRGLQDWCSFSTVGACKKRPNFNVIYAEYSVPPVSEQVTAQNNTRYPVEVQLTLALDFKNPSIMQLDQPEFKKAA